MRIKFALMLSTILVGVLCTAGACEDLKDGSEKLCGPCPDATKGGASIVGDARVDGFFRAVGNLKASFDGINAGFNANLNELAAIYDLDISGKSAADAVADIKGAIQADLAANVEGSVAVKFQRPKCTANASLAVQAQADCEVEAGCEVSAECKAGTVDVQCSGSCSGSCNGSCDGQLQCEASANINAEGQCSGSCEGSCQVKGPNLTCEGECAGTCTVEAGAHCSGSCSGTCTGTCNGSTVDGAACDGVCEGSCSGSCEIQGSGKCEGTCNGTCDYEPADGSCSGTCKGECRVDVDADASASCEGELKCDGKCEGSCSAGCEGEITPPSCSAEGSCDASADCQASASAEASASIECTPPSLELDYAFKADLDANAQASFVARIEKVRAGLAGVIHGMAKLKALVEGDASLGVEAPVVTLGASLKSIASAVADGDIHVDVPAFRIGCVAGAVGGAVDALEEVGTEGKAMVQAQADLVSVFDIL